MREFIADCNVAVTGIVKKKLIIIHLFQSTPDDKLRFLGVEKDGKHFHTPEVEKCVFVRFCDEEEKKVKEIPKPVLIKRTKR